MQNIPERIFLNISEEDMENYDDFTKLESESENAVTWCQAPIYNTDVEYIRKRTPWINVKDRLPEEGEKVFFVLEWRGIYKDYFGGSYRNGKWETEQRTYAPYSFWGIVTHWMPIPMFNE